LSIDTQTLERLLEKAQVGDVVSYKELSEAIGRDVQNGANHLLYSARARLQRDQQRVFAPVMGQGLKRLDDAAIVGTTTTAMHKVRNLARRQQQTLSCVADFDALPNDAKVKHNVALSVFGVLATVTTDKSMRKLEGRVTNGKHDALPAAKFLEAMRESL
jgi:hypothetical protein